MRLTRWWAGSNDAAGNLLNDGTNRWSYDTLGRMIAAGRDLETRTYTYNGDGVLVAETSGGSTTRYAQDLAAPLSQVLQIQQGASTSRVVYGEDRLFSVADGVRSWYGADALGSVRQTWGDVGAPSAPIWYDLWGQVEQGSVPTFGFTGELHDVGLGMVHLRARWYAPGQGRLLTRDRFLGMSAFPETLHSYAYVGNQPTLHTDPSGHCYWPLEVLRDWEPTNCANLDMAVRISQHPDATPIQRQYAHSYIQAFAGAHLPALIAAGLVTASGWGAVTAVSQWAAAHMAVGTGIGHTLTIGAAALEIGGTIQSVVEAAKGDRNAQAFLACPGIFGAATLWNDLAGAVSAGRQSLAILRQPDSIDLDIKIGFIGNNDDDELFKQFAVNITPDPDYPDFMDVVGHGTRDGMGVRYEIDGMRTTLDAKQLADVLRRKFGENMPNIRLVVCNAGVAPVGLAQQLANELGVTVLAPNKVISLKRSGELYFRDENVGGKWEEFKPK